MYEYCLVPVLSLRLPTLAMPTIKSSNPYVFSTSLKSEHLKCVIGLVASTWKSWRRITCCVVY